MVECCGENVDLEEKQKTEEKFILNESKICEVKNDQVDNVKSYSEGIFNQLEYEESEEKLMVVDENTDPCEAKEHNVCLASEQHSDTLPCDKVLLEADGCTADIFFCDIENPSNHSGCISDMKNEIDLHEVLNASHTKHDVYLTLEVAASNADSISCDIEGPSNFMRPVSVMNNEILKCNGSTNNNESPSELSKSNNETTTEPEGIEEHISTDTVGEVLMNHNKQEPSKDSETSEEAQESLIKETAVDIMPAMYQQTSQTIADAAKVTHVSVPDVIDPTTHLIHRNNQTLNNNSPASTRERSQVSNNNENSAVEDDEVINKISEDKKTSNADSISCDVEGPSNFMRSVSVMNNEILKWNGSTNNNESPSELSKSDNLDNHNVANETTTEPEGIEEHISTDTGTFTVVVL